MPKRLRASWVRLLCLLPFMASVLVPPGLMPAISSDGTITLVICTVHGPQERPFPAPDEDSEGRAASSWCPFSLLTAPVLPSAPAYPARVRNAVLADLIVADREIPPHRDLAAPQPRGPPTIIL